MTIYDNKANLAYMGSEINLSYESEPPHGGLIYSVTLPN